MKIVVHGAAGMIEMHTDVNAAIRFAARQMYLNQRQVIQVKESLAEGKDVTIQYGFSSTTFKVEEEVRI